MEAKKCLNICLIFAILLQISWAKPLNDNENEVDEKIAKLRNKDLCLQKTKYDGMEPSEKDSLLAPSNQLLKFTLRAFQELSLKYAKKAKQISESLLKDDEILNSNSAKILEFKQNLTQFEQKYSLCDGIEELFDLVEFYSNTTSFYYDLDESTLDVDTQKVLQLLRSHGSEDLDNEFEKFFNVFVEEFDKKLEGLMKDLRKENGKIGQMIADWYENFKSLKEYDDKIEAFEKYFRFYEENEEEVGE